ncbi:MAG TPA: coproporphyrinogen-III oxidase family protein [Vicinamibacteria bacterium]|nr:coproporphyrinogen-III oxidase family protein [Vicinamibacteria bacterium]
MEATTDARGTEVGSYFIANYPPFFFWSGEHLSRVEEVLDRSSDPSVALGLYLHVPFCRKRCKFCYFRVYTDKNARDVERYDEALVREMELYRGRRALEGRALSFVYFGGGTPSFLSAKQLGKLVRGLERSVSWDDAEEVTFECEPGTLSEAKLRALRTIGVSRLSLGIESWNDDILRENGRAHLSAEIERAWEWIGNVGFPYVNVDLIAGMVGETDETWDESVSRTLALAPDSVTIYQMELPYNTVYSKEILVEGKRTPVATWAQKREWLRRAFERFENAGYGVSSGYTLVKDPETCNFSYRDSLWHGADLLALGVASFSHVGGVHYQNLDRFDDYVDAVSRGELPLRRAFVASEREKLIRELILQMKLGRLSRSYFRKKFGRDILDDFQRPLGDLKERGLLTIEGDALRLSRDALLRVDSLLPRFFLPEHRSTRYT